MCMDERIFWSMSYGVYIAATMDGERPTGCVANSIMQVMAEPATIALSINHDNFTNKCIAKTGLFSFSVLTEKSDPSLIGRFGFHSGKDTDKFDGVEYEMISGVPVIRDSCGYVVCRVIDKMETPTHTVFLGQVIQTEVYEGAAAPMTYAYYHKVIKGKAPKNAPTYIPALDGAEEKNEAHAEKGKELSKWKCDVCGYIYEGEELPDDYKCPICGVDASHFIKIE